MAKKEQKAQNIGIYIGTNKDAIVEARAAINDILRSQADQSTKVVALQALNTLCSVNNARIENCSVDQHV